MTLESNDKTTSLAWWRMESNREHSGSDLWNLNFDNERLHVGESIGTSRKISRNGVRSIFGNCGGSGSSDEVNIGGDANISVFNVVLPSLARWICETDEPAIMLRASLCCDVTYRVKGIDPIKFNRPEISLLCMPKGHQLMIDIAGGVRQQGIVGVFRAATLASRYGLQDEDLPDAVRDALKGTGAVARIASFPLDQRIASLVAGTFDSSLQGEMRIIQYAARLAELVAYAFDAMQRTPALNGNALHRKRDVDLAHLALKRLEHSYRQPPLFSDLAHEIGTNRNKLKAIFKDAFGITMAEYCFERRMREAQQLLLEAEFTIAQVAERVGYEHQSSFATAFNDFVGMSPREYRLHRAPFSISLSQSSKTDHE